MKLTPSEPDIRTLIERIDQSDIDLQPDFQRQEVWSVVKKKRLIDTVLRGWSIPPIHFVETSETVLEVLDGQQRLAALRDFVHNKFSIEGNITPTDPAIQTLHGKFYRQLDLMTRRKFDQYSLRCFRITDYLPEEPSELFYRLNQPTVLTAGEQRNALFGPAREQLKSLVDYFEASGHNNKSTLGFSNARLAYDDIFARLLCFLEEGSFGFRSTEVLISERFRQKSPFDHQLIERAKKAIDLFSIARQTAQPYRFNKASVISWLLFYSRFHNMESPPDAFIQTYIETASGMHSAFFTREAVSVFEDRASLRVTDATSVVYRDFALCYIYHFAQKGPLPHTVDKSTLEQVQEALRERDDATFEFVLGQIVNIEIWGRSL